MTTIRVRALSAPKPGYAQIPMVVHVGQQARGTKQFIGLRHDASLGEEFNHYPEDGGRMERRKTGGFVGTGQPDEVDITEPEHCKHYLDALRDGDLLPGDQATAAWALDGMHPEKAAALKASWGDLKPSAEPKGGADTKTKGG